MINLSLGESSARRNADAVELLCDRARSIAPSLLDKHKWSVTFLRPRHDGRAAAEAFEHATAANPRLAGAVSGRRQLLDGGDYVSLRQQLARASTARRVGAAVETPAELLPAIDARHLRHTLRTTAAEGHVAQACRRHCHSFEQHLRQPAPNPRDAAHTSRFRRQNCLSAPSHPTTRCVTLVGSSGSQDHLRHARRRSARGPAGSSTGPSHALRRSVAVQLASTENPSRPEQSNRSPIDTSIVSENFRRAPESTSRRGLGRAPPSRPGRRCRLRAPGVHRRLADHSQTPWPLR